MTRLFSLARFAVLALLLSFTFACEDDDTAVTTQTGRLSVEITDAPIDDASVSAVFVTVTDVRLDGESVPGNYPLTVDLLALRNGNTSLLADANLEAGTYQELELVIDDATDAAGNSPGCYVQTTDGTNYPLEVPDGSALIANQTDLTLTAGGQLRAVIDFDLRKAVRRGEDSSQPYRFAARQRLESALRLVDRDQAGTLSGSVTNNSGEEGRVVVYAYAAGTYSASEAEGDSDDELFLNAVTSASLEGGAYNLSFLSAGDYELVAASYQDEDNDGTLEFAGRFRLDATLGLNLGQLSVAANSVTTADFNLGILLP